MGWWRDLMLRWGARKFELVCPHCRTPASDFAFAKAFVEKVSVENRLS